MPDFQYDQFLSHFDQGYLDWDLDPTVNGYMGAVLSLRNPPSPQAARETFSAMADCIQRFREYPAHLWPKWLPAQWVEDASFNLDRHFRAIDVGPRCDRGVAWHLLHEAYSRQLDLSHPRWECIYVHGIEDGSALLLFKMHHIYNDGMSLLMLMTEFLLTGKVGGTSGTSKSVGVVSDLPQRLAVEALNGLGQLQVIIHELRGIKGIRDLHRQAVNFSGFLREARSTHRISLPERNTKRWLVARSLPLDQFTARARRLEQGVNELFVGIVWRTLHRVYEKLDHAHSHVVVVVPVDVRSDSTRHRVDNQFRRAYVRIDPQTPSPEAAPSRAELQAAIDLGNHPISPMFAALVDLWPAPMRGWFGRVTAPIPDAVATNLVVPIDLTFGGGIVESMWAIAPSMTSTATFSLLTYRDRVHILAVVNDGVVRDVSMFERIFDDEIAEVRPPEE